jgi:RNA polymerase sigma-70 factor (ECF subfamily)
VFHLENSNTSLYAFRKFGDMVLRVAYSCCGCYAEAEDIAQDVFLYLHAKPMEFKDDEHMKAWLLKVTMNKCKNYKRSFRVSHTGTLEEDYQGTYNMDTTDIEVRELLSSLPPKYAAVMYLYYYEERTAEEIAAMLDKNVNTVKSLIRRGKEKLKIELSEEKQITKQNCARRT